MRAGSAPGVAGGVGPADDGGMGGTIFAMVYFKTAYFKSFAAIASTSVAASEFGNRIKIEL